MCRLLCWYVPVDGEKKWCRTVLRGVWLSSDVEKNDVVCIPFFMVGGVGFTTVLSGRWAPCFWWTPSRCFWLLFHFILWYLYHTKGMTHLKALSVLDYTCTASTVNNWTRLCSTYADVCIDIQNTQRSADTSARHVLPPPPTSKVSFPLKLRNHYMLQNKTCYLYTKLQFFEAWNLSALYLTL